MTAPQAPPPTPGLGRPETKGHTRDEKKTQAQKALVAAVGRLVSGWDRSGFYDRQDPAEALALHEAFRAL